MKELKEYFLRLLTLLIAGFVLFGIPYIYKSLMLLMVTWIPASFIINYLDQSISNKKKK